MLTDSVFSSSVLLSEQLLRTNEWLTDREVLAFLLKIRTFNLANNAQINGLNDPIIISGLRLEIDGMRNESFVEVLNSGNNHWVCVVACSGSDQDICLFDRLV